MKNKLTKLSLLFCMLAISQVSFAQENFIPGYIIDHKSDTIFGLVDYRNWDRNPRKIRFKENENSPSITYTPTDIMQISTYDEVYEGGVVEVENSHANTGQLDDSPELKIAMDTIFLQTLVKGGKSLYYVKNQHGINNFYIKQGPNFELLKYKKFMVRPHTQYTRGFGPYRSAEAKKYLGQLSFYLKDCGGINEKIEKTEYSRKSLIKLFANYYSCTQSEIAFQQKVDNVKMDLGVVAGIAITSLNFKSDFFDELANASFSTSTGFAGGLFLDIVIPRHRGRWSIYNEMLVTSYQVEGDFTHIENANRRTEITSKIGNTYLKINNLIRYKQEVGSAFIFVNAGVSNGFSLKEENYQSRNMIVLGQESFEEGTVLPEIKKYELGAVLGGGVELKRISLEARFERSTGMSPYASLKSPTRRYYFLLGYRF